MPLPNPVLCAMPPSAHADHNQSRKGRDLKQPSTYDRISRVNHWIVAIALIGVLSVGLYLSYGGLEREAKGTLRDYHKSFGVLILIYGTWRVLWRLVQGFPAPVGHMPGWQEKASQITHWVLLLGILSMPISGVANSVFRARSVEVFNWFTIPAQAEVPWITAITSFWHDYFGLVMAAFVLLHIAGAFKHHFIDHDATLSRMLTGRIDRN